MYIKIPYIYTALYGLQNVFTPVNAYDPLQQSTEIVNVQFFKMGVFLGLTE